VNLPLQLSRDIPFCLDMMDDRVLSLHPDIILKVECPSSNTVSFYAAHRAVLQSGFINTAIRFKEVSQNLAHSIDAPTVVALDITSEMLEIILKWFYTDTLDVLPELALDLLLAADMLFIERLKVKATMVLVAQDTDDLLTGDMGYTIFDIARVGWLTRTSRKLDPFCAKYLADRLEHCLEFGSPIAAEFEELVKDSAAQIQKREETDTIELIDDIRYYLNERFRMRFEALNIPDDADSQDIGDRNDDGIPISEDTDLATEASKTNTDEYDGLMGGIEILLDRLKLDA